MAVGFKTTESGAANFSDNLCRWKRGSAGHYEVWFLTLNDRDGRHGFWFRYALESPLVAGSGRGARVALWAAIFNRSAPERNFGLKSEFPADQFLFEGREQFNLRIADGLFSAGQASGRIEGEDHSIAQHSLGPELRSEQEDLSPRDTQAEPAAAPLVLRLLPESRHAIQGEHNG
jgi:hypothetical protein